MIISEVQNGDLKEFFPFIRKTFEDTYSIHNTPENMEIYITQNLSDEQLTLEFHNQNCLFFIGKIEERLSSYLKLNILDAQTDNHDLDAIEIERIYVDKKFQKKGLGARLINHSIEVGKNLSKPYLWLGVWNKNENAIGFYERMGFEVFDTHSFQLGDDLQTDYLMKLDL